LGLSLTRCPNLEFPRVVTDHGTYCFFSGGTYLFSSRPPDNAELVMTQSRNLIEIDWLYANHIYSMLLAAQTTAFKSRETHALTLPGAYTHQRAWAAASFRLSNNTIRVLIERIQSMLYCCRSSLNCPWSSSLLVRTYSDRSCGNGVFQSCWDAWGLVKVLF
jgi:hypothetical protein